MIRNETKGKSLAGVVQEMKSARERNRGMLIFETAPKNFCALFYLPLHGFLPLVHCLGMKFPIDVVFCNHNKKVIFKRLNVKPGSFVLPWRYIFGGARFLLEFSNCDLKDVEVGDQLSWRLDGAA